VAPLGKKCFRGEKRAGRKILEEKTRGRRGSMPKRAFTFAIYQSFANAAMRRLPAS
jgi:hypothetical protein